MALIIGIVGAIVFFHMMAKEGKARKQYFRNKAANPRPWYHFHNYGRDKNV